MKIYYIGNIRIPTEKAHGSTIAKSCEAFARAGVEVVLIVPRRKTQFTEDMFSTYHVERNFTVRSIPTFDVLRMSSARWAYWCSYIAFYISVWAVLMRLPKKDAVIYTREVPLLTLSWLGMPAFLESHHVFGKRALYFWLARKASGIITISAALKRTFVAAGFAQDRVLVSPSGVDLTIFDSNISQQEAREKLFLPTDKKIAVYTGNFTTMGADKGIANILHALKELPDVLFVAVGGSDKDRMRYESMAIKLGVETQVELRGFVPQVKLAECQRAADVLLMPFPDTPHYRSNMSPVKMFEYMASGRPIVASNLPTIAEVLNTTNATLVPPGNPKALAEAVREILSDPRIGEALAQQALKDVRRYNWSERAKCVLDFIRLT